MAKRTVRREPNTPQQKSPAQLAVQEAGWFTGQLVGALKNAQLTFLRIGGLLIEVRDKKHYQTLHHDDLITYAKERLHLGKSSLYKYIQIYEWVKVYHPEWLEKGFKGFIPELSDVRDLMWIDRELERKGSASKTRTALEALRKKALEGRLTAADLKGFRRQSGERIDPNKAILDSLCELRRRLARNSKLPGELLEHLDAMIAIMRNDQVLALAGLLEVVPMARLEMGVSAWV